MSNPIPHTYNLADEPWILVHRLDGKVDEVSLVELFERAHEFRSILGELPTQTFAIMRLALAILHRAIEGPADEQHWAALWHEDTMPAAAVSEYLSHFHQRFDLLSPETPFYQVADLHTAKGGASGLERLIADVPVNSFYFTTRLGEGLERLSFAEAARWLVHCQSFDVSGIKSGAVGDPRVKNGKGYPIGQGWAGMLGGVLAEGRTLRETLLLHLIPDTVLQLAEGADDRPVWERDPHTAAPEFEEGYVPAGPLQLYTWQSRRIRLFHDGAHVNGVLIANGDKITPHNRHQIEPMSVWRRSPAQEKRTGTITYMPKPHEPEQAIWRGLASLLEAHVGNTADTQRPGVLSWAEQARSYEVLADDYVLRTRTIGIAYGGKAATIEEVVDDAVTVAVVLLGEAGEQLRATAIDAVADAEQCARALGDLAANLTRAAGGEGDGARKRAWELAYAELDGPYRSWLATLTPESSPIPARTQWQRIARKIISDLGQELITQAGPVAWKGREVDKRHVSSPEAANWFYGTVRKALTFAYPATSSTDESEKAA